MFTTREYAVGLHVSWPTLSPTCILVDHIDSKAVRSALSPSDAPLKLPRFKAVVIEVLKNGDALAAYNGRFTEQQLAEGCFLPVLWLRNL
jgi:hypothetical protein